MGNLTRPALSRGMHFMAREIDEWLPQGIQAMINGTYDPRCLKRHYFSDEVVDQLFLSDRIVQHILLKQLKPTFKHVMNANVYHLVGPSGVQHATQRTGLLCVDHSLSFLAGYI